MIVEKQIKDQIKRYHDQKAKLDSLRALFIKPKKRHDTAILLASLAFIFLVCVPAAIWIVFGLTEDMTIHKTQYIDRTVTNKPITEQHIHPTTYNTTVVNKTVVTYAQPEYTSDCMKIEALDSDGNPSGRFSMQCRRLIK